MTDQERFARLFTIEEAQTMVTEIAPLVAEMTSAFAGIRREITDACRATGLEPGSDALPERLEERGVAPALVGRVNDLIRRITEKGCLVNGPEAGLIDFPALLDSRIVFLCWKHGEPRIDHWHAIPDGFAGRRPLLDLRPDADPSTAVH